jgi:hypothetical protein
MGEEQDARNRQDQQDEQQQEQETPPKGEAEELTDEQLEEASGGKTDKNYP